MEGPPARRKPYGKQGVSARWLRKRSISLSGHATSLALEPEFWDGLDAMAAARGVALAVVLRELDAGRAARPLASACRVAVLLHARGSGALP